MPLEGRPRVTSRTRTRHPPAPTGPGSLAYVAIFLLPALAGVLPHLWLMSKAAGALPILPVAGTILIVVLLTAATWRAIRLRPAPSRIDLRDEEPAEIGDRRDPRLEGGLPLSVPQTCP